MLLDFTHDLEGETKRPSYFSHHTGGPTQQLGRLATAEPGRLDSGQKNNKPKQSGCFSAVGARETTDLLLEPLTFLWGEGVCFGDQRDDVHFLVQPLHELNIQRLQAAGRQNRELGAAGRQTGLAVRPGWPSSAPPEPGCSAQGPSGGDKSSAILGSEGVTLASSGALDRTDLPRHNHSGGPNRLAG